MRRAVYILVIFSAVSVCQGETIYVDSNAIGSNDGSNWEDAYNFLQDALANASSNPDVNQIWVAQGTYTPDSNSTDPNGSGNREATFLLINGVGLYGGFPSGGDPNFNDREPEVYETILSGDLDGNDVDVNDPCELLTEPTRIENSYIVINGSGTDPNSILDGFTITGATHEPNTSGYFCGMFNENGDPTINNCSFIANSKWGMCNSSGSNPTVTNCVFIKNAGGGGAGMFNSNDSNPTLTDCNFTANWSYGGGGLQNNHSSPTLINCVFTENRVYAVSTGGGGMLNNDSSNPMLIGCKFIANSAPDLGGGMSNNTGSTPIVLDCIFKGNWVTAYDTSGGGVYNDGCDPFFINCVFTGNYSSSGGGMGNYNANPTLTSCIFSENLADYYGGGISNGASNPILHGCNFVGNSADYCGGGMFNTNMSSPVLTDCIFSENYAHGGGGMGNFDNSNPELTKCTFQLNSALYPGGNGAGIHNLYECLCVMENCLFVGNGPADGGGGIHNQQFSEIILKNCTFSQNFGDQGGAISNGESSSLTLRNCILWGNSTVDGSPWEIKNDGTSLVTVTYSDIGDGHSGEGNIDTDPCFAEPGYWIDVNDPNIIVEPNDPNAIWVDGDYHLQSQGGRWDVNSQRWVVDANTSPCIDAGDWMSPIGLEPFPNGGRVNMGAYGGTVEASKSYFGGQPCETIIAGDINGDCLVNFADFAIMALHWQQEEN